MSDRKSKARLKDLDTKLGDSHSQAAMTLAMGGIAGLDYTGGGRYLTADWSLNKFVMQRLQVKETSHPAGADSIYIRHKMMRGRHPEYVEQRFRFGLDAADKALAEKKFVFLVEPRCMMALTNGRFSEGSRLVLRGQKHLPYGRELNEHNYNQAAWHQLLGDGGITGAGTVRAFITRRSGGTHYIIGKLEEHPTFVKTGHTTTLASIPRSYRDSKWSDQDIHAVSTSQRFTEGHTPRDFPLIKRADNPCDVGSLLYFHPEI